MNACRVEGSRYKHCYSVPIGLLTCYTEAQGEKSVQCVLLAYRRSFLDGRAIVQSCNCPNLNDHSKVHVYPTS